MGHISNGLYYYLGFFSFTDKVIGNDINSRIDKTDRYLTNMGIARWHLMDLGHGGRGMAHAIQERDGDHGERLGQNWIINQETFFVAQFRQNRIRW